MVDTWLEDDDQLLAALKESLRAQVDVPASFTAAGQAAYAWHNIDAELAALTYDSSQDELAGAGVRATEPAALRCLTFGSARLTIELEVIGDTLHGQLVPPDPGRVELRFRDGSTTTLPVDGSGYFTATPLPVDSFRIHCVIEGNDTGVLTDWVKL